jgi:hypothetical protein
MINTSVICLQFIIMLENFHLFIKINSKNRITSNCVGWSFSLLVKKNKSRKIDKYIEKQNKKVLKTLSLLRILEPAYHMKIRLYTINFPPIMKYPI